jgi:hypothetical protein
VHFIFSASHSVIPAVIPVKTGIQARRDSWIPACAGMTGAWVYVIPAVILAVIPVKTGIHFPGDSWIPAFAGMTGCGEPTRRKNEMHPSLSWGDVTVQLETTT